MKCRLCLCFVDKQMGYSSLIDNGFNNMIKQVLCFAMETDHNIPAQQSNLPVMVCNQCFITVRNFYSFSKMVEANQKTLRSECTEQNVSMSIDEFVRSIKLENGLEHNAKNGISNNTLLMTTEVETIAGQQNIPTAPQGQVERMCEPTEARFTCIDKGEVMEHISMVERRISIVTAELAKAVRCMPKLNTAELSSLPAFDFSPITSEQELISFNTQLADKEYLKLFLEWFDTKSGPENGADARMHDAIDVIFGRPFLAGCSWTGVSTKDKKKIPLMKYKEVLELFRLIGSTGGFRINEERVREFFFRKLRVANHRLQLLGIRKSVCRLSRSKRIQ